MIFYFVVLVVGGFGGWLIDTAYRTKTDKKYSPRTFLPYFSLIYGYAAVVLHMFFYFVLMPFWWQVIVGTIIAIFLELMSGVFALTFLDRRFWDYGKSKCNLCGFIDLEHSFYWFILVLIYRLAFPFLT